MREARARRACRRLEIVTAKERLHRAIDDLSESQAEEALRYLERRRDPAEALLEWLQSAPEDDEATTAKEDTGAREAWAEYRRGESAPLEQVRRELA